MGTTLVSFSVQVVEATVEVSALRPDRHCFFLWEHPEDLGTCVREEDGMHIQPASVWQLEGVRSMVNRGRPPIFTVVFNQCCFGALYRKPTRILTNLPALRSWGPRDWPLMDDDGFYMGPIQDACPCAPSMSLARKPHDQEFRTSSTSAYPPKMDAAIASAIQHAFKNVTFPSGGVGTCQVIAGTNSTSSAGSSSIQARAKTPHTESTQVGFAWPSDTTSAQSSDNMKKVWGRGTPIMAWYKGSSRPIHDGGGLLSPGRWPIERRDLSLDPRGERLRILVHGEFKRWCQAVEASGKDVMKDKFWRAAAGSVSESLFTETVACSRKMFDDFLAQEGLDPLRRRDDVDCEVAFRRVAAVAEVLGDADFHYLQDVARHGVPIGVGVELPRVPDVFEPKVKWNLSEAEGEFVDTKAENYSSAAQSMSKIKEQISDDIEKGFVIRMSRADAEEKYRGRLAAAALGAVPKALDSDDVRVVHDGSYSVDVNRRIRVRDRMRCPLVDDAEAVLRQVKVECAENPGIRFGMAYDVAHAHRLIPVRQEGWGYQAFSLDDPGEVFLHKRGAFGIASAAYWWQRFAATLIRSFHMLAGVLWAVYHLLYADDGWLAAQGKYFGYSYTCLFWLFLFDLFEVPLSWRKLRGGVRLQWIGYELSLDAFQVGISQRKREWIVKWVETTLARGGITGRDLKSALGRLVFVSGALRHVRPFLGTLFSWSAVLAPGTCAAFPLGARLVLELILQEVGGCRMVEVCDWPRYPVDCFRIDAKAEKDDIVLGGWETLGGKPPEKALWFSIRLSRSSAPWAFVKGEPYRSIAALELTAVLVAIILFSKFGSLKGVFASGALPALTDSKVSAHVIDKFLSCSFPLSVVLMEVSLQLHRMNTRLMLRWIPREQNIQADALTNEVFHGFREESRIHMDFEDIDFLILPKLMSAAQEVDAEVRMRKSKRNSSAPLQGMPVRRRKKGEAKWKDPW